MPTETADRVKAFRARRQAGREGGRLLSAGEAADYTGWPYSTLAGLAARGELPVVRLPGSRRNWFDREDLDRAIAAWKTRLT
jgi:excisionase family DNA binding protein